MHGEVLIAGGGIGGVAAALALARAGFAVRVFEARPDPTEAGAGLQVSANGVKALRALGIESALTARASRPEAIELRLPDSGRVVSRVELGKAHEEAFGAPYLHLHRADLHDILMDAARAHASIAIELGRRVLSASQSSQSVTVDLDDGRQVSGSFLLGADGVRSTLRHDVAGQDTPRFTGMMAWRATVPMSEAELTVPPVATVWMGKGRHLVTYPLLPRRMMNLVGVVEREGFLEESWSAQGSRDEMMADFGGWHAETDALLARADQPLRWALYDHAPLSVWSAGRIALLGDACHATPPFLAQGACMALEDAVVLARCVTRLPDDIPRALRDYGEARHQRTERVLKASWANAWRFHLESPLLRTLVYGGLAIVNAIAPSGPAHMFDWLYNYSPIEE